MDYLKQIEQQFRDLYWGAPEESIVDDLVDFVKEKVLESYKNGLQASKQSKARPRGENRQSRARK